MYFLVIQIIHLHPTYELGHSEWDFFPKKRNQEVNTLIETLKAREFTEEERAQAVVGLIQILGDHLKANGKKPALLNNDSAIGFRNNEDLEVYVWLDGCVQATMYNEDLGGLFDPIAGRNLKDVVDNPSLVFQDCESLIEKYEEALEELEEDDY
jgi:hypothetical protein